MKSGTSENPYRFFAYNNGFLLKSIEKQAPIEYNNNVFMRNFNFAKDFVRYFTKLRCFSKKQKPLF